MILFILSIKTADFKLCASMTEEIVKLKNYCQELCCISKASITVKIK